MASCKYFSDYFNDVSITSSSFVNYVWLIMLWICLCIADVVGCLNQRPSPVVPLHLMLLIWSFFGLSSIWPMDLIINWNLESSPNFLRYGDFQKSTWTFQQDSSTWRGTYVLKKRWHYYQKKGLNIFEFIARFPTFRIFLQDKCLYLWKALVRYCATARGMSLNRHKGGNWREKNVQSLSYSLWHEATQS